MTKTLAAALLALTLAGGMASSADARPYGYYHHHHRWERWHHRHCRWHHGRRWCR